MVGAVLVVIIVVLARGGAARPLCDQKKAEYTRLLPIGTNRVRVLAVLDSLKFIPYRTQMVIGPDTASDSSHLTMMNDAGCRSGLTGTQDGFDADIWLDPEGKLKTIELSTFSRGV